MFMRQLQAYISLFMCANLVIGRRPTCVFQKSELGWASCNEFIQQDRNEKFKAAIFFLTIVCCAIGTYPFRKIISKTTISGPVQTMFNFSSHLDNVKHMFVLDRSKRCLMPSQCFLLDADSSFSFKQNVQFKLTGDEPFHVLYFSETEYNHWILNATSKECKYLQASSILIDRDGESRSDLILRIRPPDGNQVAQANISSVCLHIHSARNSNTFTCTKGVKSQGEVKRHFCIDNPFGNDGVLRVHNATHFYNGSHELTHHCAQATMGAYCHLLSEMLIVTPPEVRVPTTSYYIPNFLTPALWILTSSLCALLVFSCLVHLLRRSRNHHEPGPVSPEEPLIEMHSRGVLSNCKEDSNVECTAPCRAVLRHAPTAAAGRDRAADVRQLRHAFRTGGPAAKPESKPAPKLLTKADPVPSRLVLLYTKPADAGDCTAFTAAVRALRRLLSARGVDGSVQVVDMYEDPLVLEDGAVMRASSLLGDEDVRLVVVSSPDMVDALRATHRDTYQVFISTVLLGICHAPDRMARRVFVVSLDTCHRPNFFDVFPFQAHYALPYHLDDLLKAIPGLSVDVSSPGRKKADEQALRKSIKQYTLLKVKASVVEL